LENENPGESKIRRSNMTEEIVDEPLEGVDTVYAIMKHAARNKPDQKQWYSFGLIA
jgi:hypothetical protein